MPIQHRRTRVPNLAPTGLLPGQLSVEMATNPPRLWCGVPASIDPMSRREIGGVSALPVALLAAQSMLRGYRVNNTTYNFSVSKVAVRDAAGEGMIVNGTAGLQCNVNNVGANGRDQTAAFANNIWVHFYWIYNPSTQTLAAIGSTRLPSAGGPNPMPAGFTHWCYLGTIRRTNLLLRVRILGEKFFYVAGTDNWVLLYAVPWNDESFSFAPFVPTIADDFDMQIFLYGASPAANGNGALRLEPGYNFLWLGQVPYAHVTCEATFPNIIPQTLYIGDPTWTGAANMSAAVIAYRCPNGAM